MGERDRRSLLKLLGMGTAGLGPGGVVGRGLLEPAGATALLDEPQLALQKGHALTTRLRPPRP